MLYWKESEFYYFDFLGNEHNKCVCKQKCAVLSVEQGSLQILCYMFLLENEYSVFTITITITMYLLLFMFQFLLTVFLYPV